MGTEEVDDATLLRQIQAGAQEAVGVLYDRYGGLAYGLALRVTGDPALAEDAVQEAFVSLWRHSSRFDPSRGQVRSWLMTMVHNKAVDMVRRRTNRNERALPDAAEEPQAMRGQPDVIAEWTLDAEAVRAAVRQVPEDQRRTIELAYFDGLTHVQIAARMGVPLGTVKSRLRIGLEKMREHLRPMVLE
jgi:RNA polymerase sigma-70 factor (ECF subfamily)